MANFPFLGIVLGRREIKSDGSKYLNWAERACQVTNAARAGNTVGQPAIAANGFTVQPQTARAQLLIVYRTVWKGPEKRAAYYAR